MPGKPEPIPADPNDPEDRDVSAAGVRQGQLCREVRRARRATGLTQAAFAERYGLKVGTLRDWEQGRIAPPLYAVAFLTLTGRDERAAAVVAELRGDAA
jgi:putative transcriptional regulator